MEGAPRLMLDIRDACARGDSESLRLHAHSLKGCLSYFSSESTVRAASILEVMGLNGELTGVDTAYKALEVEMARLRRALLPMVEEHAK